MTKFEEEVKRPDNTGIEPFSKRDVDFSKLAAKFARAAQTLKKWREYAGYLGDKLDTANHNLYLETEQSAAYHAEIVELKRENQRLVAENLAVKTLVDKLNGQNVDLKGELEEVRDLQGEANNQAAKEYIDRCEAESKLKELKSQLQQQALPVVPECVSEWIEILKSKGLKPLKNPETYGETGFTEEKLQNIVFWISEHQEDYLRAWLDGYTVKKTKLFYLKNKLTGDCLAICLARASSGLYVEVTEKWLTRKEQTSYKLSFTQQEIDSMQTGSYEQIPVPVEDNK